MMARLRALRARMGAHLHAIGAVLYGLLAIVGIAVFSAAFVVAMMVPA